MRGVDWRADRREGRRSHCVIYIVLGASTSGPNRKQRDADRIAIHLANKSGLLEVDWADDRCILYVPVRQAHQIGWSPEGHDHVSKAVFSRSVFEAL